MTNQIPEVVHIIPLGHEIDRAVRPFDTAIANRVYLIVDTGEGSSEGKSDRDKKMDELQKTLFTPAVTKLLEAKKIAVNLVETKTFDLETLLRAITSLIRLEQERGSNIFINMSGSGRLGAVAAFMAGSAYHIPTYYVHSEHFAYDNEREEHGMSICEANNVSYLPEFKFSIPNKAESMILRVLYDARHDAHPADFLSAKDILGFLEMNQVEDYVTRESEMMNEPRVIESRKLMRLSNVMRKMIDDGYVCLTKEGRKAVYRITKLGEHAFCLCGMDKDMYAEMFGGQSL